MKSLKHLLFAGLAIFGALVPTVPALAVLGAEGAGVDVMYGQSIRGTTCVLVENPTPASHTTCRGARLADLDLAHVNLTYADLEGTSFSKVNFAGAQLNSANLVGTSFVESLLDSAGLINVNATRASFSNLSMKDVSLYSACLVSARFLNVDLGGSRLMGADAMRARFEGCTLAGADITNAKFTRTQFRYTRWIDGSVRNEFTETIANVGRGRRVCQVQSMAVDQAGNIYFTDVLAHQIFRLDSRTQVVTPIAGLVEAGFNGDGPASEAKFNRPIGLALDTSGGILYVADMNNYRLRSIDLATQTVTTLLGDGNKNHLAPGFILLDRGSLYIASNHQILKLDLATRQVTPFAGCGVKGFTGDTGPATRATMTYAAGMTFDRAGNFYFSDGGNDRVRWIDITTGIIDILAGSIPRGSAQGGGGAGASGDDDLLQTQVARSSDTASATCESRDDDSSDILATIPRASRVPIWEGSPAAGFSGDGGLASRAQLRKPKGLAIDPVSNLLYIADSWNHRIRTVNLSTGVIDTVAGNGAFDHANAYNGPANRGRVSPDALAFLDGCVIVANNKFIQFMY